MLWIVLGISAGGVLGAICRYQLGRMIMEKWGRTFPIGTFVINVTGAFVICFLAALNTRFGLFSAALYTAMTVGFLGAYTTFSTYAYEAIKLLEDRESLNAAGYVLGSVLAGLAAAWLGYLAGFRI